MMPPPETMDLARRILADEAVEGKSSAEPMHSATTLVNEKLRPYLCALVGVAGYQGILSRALTLAREEVPSLGAVQVTPEGRLQGLSGIGPQIDKDHPQEGGVILLARLLGLFLTFIGEALTLRLVQDIAPHLDLTVTMKSGTSTPFEAVLQEVGQLKKLSERLTSLANQYPAIDDALMSISGNIRNTAALLEVLVHIRGESGAHLKDEPEQESGPYVM